MDQNRAIPDFIQQEPTRERVKKLEQVTVEVLCRLAEQITGQQMQISMQALYKGKTLHTQKRPWMPEQVSVEFPSGQLTESSEFVIHPGSSGYFAHTAESDALFEEQMNKFGSVNYDRHLAYNTPIPISPREFLKIPEIKALVKKIIMELPDADMVKDYKGSLERRLHVYD